MPGTDRTSPAPAPQRLRKISRGAGRPSCSGVVWGRGEASENVNERVRCGGVGSSWGNCGSRKEARPAPADASLSPAPGQASRAGPQPGRAHRREPPAAGTARGGASCALSRFRHSLVLLIHFCSVIEILKKIISFNFVLVYN